MEPIHYLRIFRRRWWVIAAAFLVAVLAVLATTPATSESGPSTQTSDTTYKATAALLLQSQGGAGDDSISESRSLTAFLATTGEVPKRVAAKLAFPGEPAELAALIEVNDEARIPAIRISSSGKDPARAAQLANEFANELVTYTDELQQAKYQAAIDGALARAEGFQAQIRKLPPPPAGDQPPTAAETAAAAQRDALARQYSQAFERYQQLLAEGRPASGLTVIEPAVAVADAPGGASFKAPSTRGGRLALLGGLSLLLGAGVVLLVDRFDHRLATKEEAERAFGLPVVAEIPLLPKLRRRRTEVISAVAPGSMSAEAYRMLRTALLLMPAGSGHAPASNGRVSTNGHAPGAPPDGGRDDRRRPPQVILVTSPGPNEGKTTSVANLAAVFAEAGHRVLVLSFDLRCPRVHELLGLEEGAGLADVMAATPGAPDLRSVSRLTDVPGVTLVSSGSMRAMTECIVPPPEVLAEARTLAEIVLIDSSPLLTMSNAAELVPSVDAVLLVARAGSTDGAAARRSVELLSRLGAPVTGVALVGVTELPGRPRGYYRERLAAAGPAVGMAPPAGRSTFQAAAPGPAAGRPFPPPPTAAPAAGQRHDVVPVARSAWPRP